MPQTAKASAESSSSRGTISAYHSQDISKYIYKKLSQYKYKRKNNTEDFILTLVPKSIGHREYITQKIISRHYSRTQPKT